MSLTFTTAASAARAWATCSAAPGSVSTSTIALTTIRESDSRG
ncbi:hypothetical protein [Streptomyces sp. NBC_01483]|nr:hypothetical protein [Streptomyces sp. NBC_01483]